MGAKLQLDASFFTHGYPIFPQLTLRQKRGWHHEHCIRGAVAILRRDLLASASRSDRPGGAEHRQGSVPASHVAVQRETRSARRQIQVDPKTRRREACSTNGTVSRNAKIVGDDRGSQRSGRSQADRMHPQGVHSALPGPAIPGSVPTRQTAAPVAFLLVRPDFLAAFLPSHLQRV